MKPHTITMTMPARNAQKWTMHSLSSLIRAVDLLRWADRVQVVLLDDASDPDLGIMQTFKEFRKVSQLPTRIFRFWQQQHYSRMFSAALSAATGDKVFFLSNDMIFTPEFFKTLLDVSSLDPAIGIVRGTSTYTDSHPEHTLAPPLPIRALDDVYLFSTYIAAYYKQHFVQDRVLSGDAILVNRALIDKIGVVDPRYFGYFGDIDYGVRAVRAGFKLVCAKGAWLLHEGAAYIKDEVIRTKTQLSEHHPKRMQTVLAAYATFQEKWGGDLPADYEQGMSEGFPQLLALQPADLHAYVPPVALSTESGEWD